MRVNPAFVDCEGSLLRHTSGKEKTLFGQLRTLFPPKFPQLRLHHRDIIKTPAEWEIINHCKAAEKNSAPRMTCINCYEYVKVVRKKLIFNFLALSGEGSTTNKVINYDIVRLDKQTWRKAVIGNIFFTIFPACFVSNINGWWLEGRFAFDLIDGLRSNQKTIESLMFSQNYLREYFTIELN